MNSYIPPIKSFDLGLASTFTFVLWTTCCAVDVMGLLLPHQLPRPPQKEVSPIEAQTIQVALSEEATPSRELAPASAVTTEPPPALPPRVVAPSAPERIAVSEPSPSIVATAPQMAATQTVPTSATKAPNQAAPTTADPAIRHVTFGEGEGRQPAPEYPREAVIAHRQGTVVVQFVVGADGRVISAVLSKPCRWEMLNQSALRAVRDTWRFAFGSERTLDVSIEFTLEQSHK